MHIYLFATVWYFCYAHWGLPFDIIKWIGNGSLLGVLLLYIAKSLTWCTSSAMDKLYATNVHIADLLEGSILSYI